MGITAPDSAHIIMRYNFVFCECYILQYVFCVCFLFLHCFFWGVRCHDDYPCVWFFFGSHQWGTSTFFQFVRWRHMQLGPRIADIKY